MRNRLGILFDVDHLDPVPGPAQDRRQVAEAEIALVLKADEHDRPRRVAVPVRRPEGPGSMGVDGAKQDRLRHRCLTGPQALF